MHVLTYDTNLNLISKKDFEIQDHISKDDKVLALAQLNKGATLFFADDNLELFSYLYVNSEKTAPEKVNFFVSQEHDKYLGSFSVNGKFYVMLLRKYKASGPHAKPGKTYSLTIEEIDNNYGISEHEIALSDLDFSAKNGGDIGKLFQDAPLYRCDQNYPDFLHTATNKFYYDSNYLSFTFNAVTDTTQILLINMRTFARTFIKIPSGIPICKNDFGSDNSCLISDRLFYLAACNDYLILKVFNIKTGAVLKEYITQRNYAIPYKSGGFYHTYSGIWSGGTDKEEPKNQTADILNKLSATGARFHLGIGAFAEGDMIKVSIGVSEDYINSYSYFYYPFFNNFVGMPVPPVHMMSGFHILMPALTKSLSGYQSDQGWQSYYFNARFDKETLEPLQIKPEVPEFHKLNVEIERLSSTYDILSVTTTKSGPNQILSYYDSANEQFVVTVFTPDDK